MHGLNMYDYGARQQDPAVGMFTSMDPLCEKYYNISPYSYCAGNPIRYVDPDGRDIYTLYKDGSLILDKICKGDDKISYGEQSFTIHHGAFGKTTRNQIRQDFSKKELKFRNVKDGLKFMQKVSKFTEKELSGLGTKDKSGHWFLHVAPWKDNGIDKNANGGLSNIASNNIYKLLNGEIGKYKIHTHTKVTGLPRTGTAILSEADLMFKYPNGGSYLMTTSDGVIYNYTNITYKNQIQNLINKRNNDKLRHFIVSPKNIINNDD